MLWYLESQQKKEIFLQNCSAVFSLRTCLDERAAVIGTDVKTKTHNRAKDSHNKTKSLSIEQMWNVCVSILSEGWCWVQVVMRNVNASVENTYKAEFPSSHTPATWFTCIYTHVPYLHIFPDSSHYYHTPEVREGKCRWWNKLECRTEILPFHRKAVSWINGWVEPNSSIIRSDRDLSPLLLK